MAKKYDVDERDLLTEGRSAIQLMDEFSPAALDNARQYDAAFARQEVATAASRAGAEQGVIDRLGAGYLQSLKAASPELAAGSASLVRSLNATGPGELENELNTQALEDLRRRGQLSGEDARLAAQQARASLQARGLGTGQAAALAEVLNRQSFSDARQSERRGFALGVDAQRTQRRASDATIAASGFGALASVFDPQQRLFGSGGSQQSGQVAGTNRLAPFMAASQQVGAANQEANYNIDQLNESIRQWQIGRKDTAHYTAMNRSDSMANAAAQRKSNTTNAAISGAASIAAIAALAFL